MASAADLDMSRLGKQRAECKQIIQYLAGDGPKTPNPLACDMWDGWIESLIIYGLCICHEWRVVRKFRDDTWGWLAIQAKRFGIDPKGWIAAQQIEHPPWKNDKWLIRSHRSNLIGKSEIQYGELFSGTPLEMPYFWPKQETPGSDYYDLYVSVADMGRLDNGTRRMPRGTSIELQYNGMGLVVVGGD